MNPDDPKLTAYALDELEEPDRTEVEERLRNDPAAAAEVAALREFSAQLRAELHKENMPGLTEDQRAELYAAAKEVASGLNGNPVSAAGPAPAEPELLRPSLRPWRLWFPAAIAASLALFAVIHPLLETEKRQVALGMKESAPAPASAPDPAIEKPAEEKSLAEEPAVRGEPAPGRARALRKSLVKADGAVSVDVRSFKNQAESNAPAPAPLMLAPAEKDRKEVDLLTTDLALEDRTALRRSAPVPPLAVTQYWSTQPSTIPKPALAAPVQTMQAAGHGGQNEAAAGGFVGKQAKPTTTASTLSGGRGDSSGTAVQSKAMVEREELREGKQMTTRKGGEAPVQAQKMAVAVERKAKPSEPESKVEKREKAPSGAAGYAPAGAVASAASSTRAMPVPMPAPAAPMAAAPVPAALALVPDPAASMATAPVASVPAGPTAADADTDTVLPGLKPAAEGLATGVAGQSGLALDGIKPPSDRERNWSVGRKDALQDLDKTKEHFFRWAMVPADKPSPAENPFTDVQSAASVEFTVNPNTAGYNLVRASLQAGQSPVRDGIRIEEMLNHFSYSTPPVQTHLPIAVALESASCPWAPDHRLVRIGLRGRAVSAEGRGSNVVLLSDLSEETRRNAAGGDVLGRSAGTKAADKLGESLGIADTNDAFLFGIVKEPAEVAQVAADQPAVDDSSKIEASYKVARDNYKASGNNRVVLVTDGGIVKRGLYNRFVETAAENEKAGIPLTVVCVGQASEDERLRGLAWAGGGNYAYFESDGEARKALSDRRNETLVTAAEAVRATVTFNPSVVQSYRLLGYENDADAKSGTDQYSAFGRNGTIGAGQEVTALFELVPRQPLLATTELGKRSLRSTNALGGGIVEESVERKKDEPPKLGTVAAAATKPASAPASAPAAVLFNFRLDCATPDGPAATFESSLADSDKDWKEASEDFRWSAAVASFGLILRDSTYKGDATWDLTLQIAKEAKGQDANGERQEFLDLVQKAKTLGQ